MYIPPVVERMLTVGREAIVLRDYRLWDREYRWWCAVASINGNSSTAVIGILQGEVRPVRVRRSRSASLPKISRWLVLLAPDAVTDMNADPSEHAEPPVTLIELFYENILDLVSGVC